MIHPAFLYLFAAALIPLLSGKARKTLQLAVPPLAGLILYNIVSAGPDSAFKAAFSIGSVDFLILRTDSLSTLFASIFILFSFFANLYALHSNHKYVHAAANAYAGSSIGAVLAGDVITLFVFWEIMAIASACLIWNRRKPSSMGSLYRYLMMHGAGGLCFFTGILLKLIDGQSMIFSIQKMDLAGIMMFTAFAINAGIPPLHAWLPDAYPAGRAESSIYLCTFTTKVAVYAFARAFAGSELLLWLGVAAAVHGVIYALMENDIRRLLSYHIVCQVGYMLIGIAIGTHLGINGGTGHAVGNILFKGLLFMAAGALMQMTGHTKLSDLGGLYSKAPWVFVFHMLGAFSIAGMPFLNGYVTKSLLVAAAVYDHRGWLEPVLMAVAVGTFLSIGLKLAYFAFFHTEKPAQPVKTLPANCYLAMALTGGACIYFGVFPSALYRFLPYEVHYEIFTAGHIVQTLQMLAGTFLGFTLILRWLHTKDVITLDVDWFYRECGRLFVRGVCLPMRYGQEAVQEAWTVLIEKMNILFAKIIPQQKICTVGMPLLWIVTTSLLISLFLILRL